MTDPLPHVDTGLMATWLALAEVIANAQHAAILEVKGKLWCPGCANELTAESMMPLSFTVSTFDRVGISKHSTIITVEGEQRPTQATRRLCWSCAWCGACLVLPEGWVEAGLW